MKTDLPADDEVARQLAEVRVRVIEGTRVLRSPRHTTAFRRTRNVVAVGIAGVALSAGAIIVGANGTAQAYSVRCFGDASLNAPVNDVLFVDGHRTGVNSDRSFQIDPIELCAVDWATGTFKPGADPTNTDRVYPVPPLTACTLNNGIAAVFPNREKLTAQRLCGTLGLAVWDPDSGV